MLDGESMTTATHKWNGHAFIKKKKKPKQSCNTHIMFLRNFDDLT